MNLEESGISNQLNMPSFRYFSISSIMTTKVNVWNIIATIVIATIILWILRRKTKDAASIRTSKNINIASITISTEQKEPNENIHEPHHPQANIATPPLKLLGPSAPQEIKFIVTTPPSEVIPLLHPKHASIKRQLVFNLQQMTWEIRKPVTGSNGRTPGTGDQHEAIHLTISSSEIQSNDSKGEYASWEIVDQSLPIESMLNVSAHGDHLGTMDVIFDATIVERKDHLQEDLMRHQVTVDTWKKSSDAVKKKRKKDERAFHDDLGLGLGFAALDDYSVSDASTINNSRATSGDGTNDGGGSAAADESVGSNATHVKRKEKKGVARKGKSGETQKEYTFATEFEAGAFQTLFLASRIVGREIQNLYKALELVHRRSEAFGFDEHGHEPGGVALGDVQRCLSDLSFIDKRIARICHGQRLYQMQQQQQQQGGDDTSAGLAVVNTDDSMNELRSTRQERADLYKGRRTVLGFVDFFWLFVPTVLHGTPYSSPMAADDNHFCNNHDNIGGIDEHQARVRQLIKIRQRVAKAAVRVCSYVNAMEVVHEGWKIPTCNDSFQLRTRLAFDSEEADTTHDVLSLHEYYDPMLSRVNLAGTTISDDSSTLLPILQQAYVLVGCHVVRLSQNAEIDIVTSDPLALIPSLRDIVEKHSELQFFVACIVQNKPKAATIMLYTRWLPEHGVDSGFDSCFEQFSTGTPAERNKLLQIGIRVGNKSCSFLSSIFNNSGAQKDMSWTSFQKTKLADGNRVHHFGGLEQSDPLFPTNYLAITCQIDTDAFTEQWCKPLGRIIPSSGNGNLVDLVLQLECSHRSLAATRIVHCNSKRVMSWEELCFESSAVAKISHLDVTGLDTLDVPNEDDRDEDRNAKVETLKEILSLITVPVRSTSNYSTEYQGISHGKESIIDGQVLSFFTDNEILQHFIAANENLKEAAIRITKSAAFRGLTFPIDIRTCQVELRSGQFLHHGHDLNGDPIFYFRNMCTGLWRKKIDASTSAILYTFDKAVRNLSKTNPNFKCTLVVLMGKVYDFKSSVDDTPATDERVSESDDVSAESNSPDETTSESVNESEQFKPKNDKKKKELFVHTNFQFVERLINIVSQNYPERLGKVIVVPSGGWEKWISTHGLRRYIQSSKTRSKVTVVDGMKDLKNFISVDQMIGIVKEAS